jgi:hypothetical protein
VVLYSPQTSLNGAKLLLNKGPPRKITIEDMSDALAAPTIITPHALPMFRDGEGDGRGTKRKRDKERMDPRKSKRPELPVTGPGRGGRVGASATQHIVQNLVRDTTRDEDVSLLLVPLLDVDARWPGNAFDALETGVSLSHAYFHFLLSDASVPYSLAKLFSSTLNSRTRTPFGQEVGTNFIFFVSVAPL